jgi:hypothetical protein
VSLSDEPVVNPQKVRLGLALISVTVLAAVVLFFAIEAPAGKAVMLAIAVIGVVRAYLLYRSIRREPPGA